jgi:hypothetical protein
MGKPGHAKLRRCPSCQSIAVNIDELSSGSRCLHCHETVEVNAIYSIGLSLVLAVLVSWAFRNSYGPLGLFFTALLCIYSSGYKQITSNFFPLKVYKD